MGQSLRIIRYYSMPRNGAILMAYEKFLRDMAIELGAEPSVAAKDAATVVDMEIALVKVSGLLLIQYGKYQTFILKGMGNMMSCKF